jgi:hypothetical protein
MSYLRLLSSTLRSYNTTYRSIYRSFSSVITKENVPASNAPASFLTERKKNPHVYFDISIAGLDVGRLTIELYKDISPKAAEGFRSLCVGGKNKSLSYKGTAFRFIVSELAMNDGIWEQQLLGSLIFSFSVFFTILFVVGDGKVNFLKEREIAAAGGKGGGEGSGSSGIAAAASGVSGDGADEDDEEAFFDHLRKLDSGEIAESDDEFGREFGNDIDIDSDSDNDSDSEDVDVDDDDEDGEDDDDEEQEDRNGRSRRKKPSRQEYVLYSLLSEMESNVHQPFNVHKLYLRFVALYPSLSPSLSPEQQEEMSDLIETLRRAMYERSYDSLTSHRMPHHRMPRTFYPISYYRDDLRAKGYRYYGDLVPAKSTNNDNEDDDDEEEGEDSPKVTLLSVVKRLVEMKGGNKNGLIGKKLKEVLVSSVAAQYLTATDNSDSDSSDSDRDGSGSSSSEDDELEEVDEHDERLLQEEGKDIKESDSKRLKAVMRSGNFTVGKEERNRDSDLELGEEEGDLLEVDDEIGSSDDKEEEEEEMSEEQFAKELAEIEQEARVGNRHYKKGLISVAPGDKKGTLGTEVMKVFVIFATVTLLILFLLSFFYFLSLFFLSFLSFLLVCSHV